MRGKQGGTCSIHEAITLSRALLALVIALAVTLCAAFLGVTKALGAHPFWATDIALIGSPLGLVAAILFARLPRFPVLVGFIILTAVSYAVAHYGKTAFAASFAEDELAGRFWFFGWIATTAAFTASIATLLRR